MTMDQRAVAHARRVLATAALDAQPTKLVPSGTDRFGNTRLVAVPERAPGVCPTCGGIGCSDCAETGWMIAT